MTSVALYLCLVAAVGLERLAELVVSQRHLRWARSRGGVETGRGHYPAMVGLHVVLLAGCVAEVAWLDRPFVAALGWPMLALVVASQSLRWWCIATLGRQWNARVIIVPGLTRVSSGPYRWLRHPMYVGVLLGMWATPRMSFGHLLLALAMTGYVLIAMRYEERDLIQRFGSRYSHWRGAA